MEHHTTVRAEYEQIYASKDGKLVPELSGPGQGFGGVSGSGGRVRGKRRKWKP
jgi:hypothetical protein